MADISGFGAGPLLGGTYAGEPLSARTINRYAGQIHSNVTNYSNDLTFQNSSGGVVYGVNQQATNQFGYLEQFQILIAPYAVGENTTDFSIIRVVKGEVVWKPKLTGETPTFDTCTTQTTIENWYVLPTFPVIDDENSIFIGDGGIRVPNIDGTEVGIFIFKATGLPVDVPPIIVAAPNYTPACPVVFPGTPPVADAVWEVVQIGSAVRASGSWTVTQKYIGSLSLPGSGGGETPPAQALLPAQLQTQVSESLISPFQCVITQVNDKRYLRIVNGTISYTASNMPLINTGAFTHTKQAWMTKVQICPEGMRTENIYPSFDPDPQFNNYWMENEGGYELSDTNDPIVLYAFKWDVAPDTPPFNASSVVNTGLPTLALIAQSNSADTTKITKDSGPSIYQQTMNVKPMGGYKAEDISMTGDWGYSHTTYLNPRKIGYNYKAIATVIANANSFSCIVGIEQVGVANLQNTVQRIALLGEAASGFINFTYDGETSTVPFPVVDEYTETEIISSDELALLRCLNSIPALTGNVQVSRSAPYVYVVTFINELQGQAIPALVADTSEVTAFEYRFDVIQYHTGNLDLTTPMQFGMTQLMNKDNLNEPDDPYYANKNSIPPWKDICNKDDVLACDGFSGDVTTDGVTNMSGYTDNNPNYTVPASADACDYPFQVKRTSFVAEEYGEFTICSGMVNNVIPGNMEDTFILLNGYIYLEVAYDSANKIFPGTVMIATTEDEVPDSTKDVSYVAIARIVDGAAEQLITGSLWGDRIQTGYGEGEKAYYYYAQV